MTLNDLAKNVGSDVGNLSRIERGVQMPNARLAERICNEFNGEINELQLIYPARYDQAPPLAIANDHDSVLS